MVWAGAGRAHTENFIRYANPYLDKQMAKLNLTEQEKVDLINCLIALNGEGWRDKVAPDSFPQ